MTNSNGSEQSINAPLINQYFDLSEVRMRPDRLIQYINRIPVLGTLRQRMTGWLHDGKVVTIRWGQGKGLRWRRYPGYSATTFLGWHEPAVQRALTRYVRPGDVVYDVGAHMGFFTLIAARIVGPQGSVVAFEPYPPNAAVIRELIDLNQVTNCQVVQAAVCDRTGEVDFSAGARPNRARMPSVDPRVKANQRVAAISLDDYAASHQPPTFIKLDAERAEVLVLQGMRQLLSSRHTPRILLEAHTPQLAAQCRAMLEQAGYQFCGLNGRPIGGRDLVAGHYLALPGTKS